MNARDDDREVIITHITSAPRDETSDAGRRETERRRVGKAAIAEIRARLDAIRQKGRP